MRKMIKSLPKVTVPEAGATVEQDFTVSRLASGMGWGIYGSAFYNDTNGVFPESMFGLFLPEGTKIRVTVEVLKTGKKKILNPWELRDYFTKAENYENYGHLTSAETKVAEKSLIFHTAKKARIKVRK
jgi:hypothetical protein